MAAIDIGPEAIDRGSNLLPYTIICADNPANLDGKITSVEIWAMAGNPLSNFEVGIFYSVGANTFTTRDHQAIGAVAAGAKQTKVVDLDVMTGDYIGCYFTAGRIERDTAGFAGIWTLDGDYIPALNNNFGPIVAGDAVSLKGLGAEAEAIVGSKSPAMGAKLIAGKFI